MMRGKNKRLLLMAALLAGSSAIEVMDDVESSGVQIRAEFPEDAEGGPRTSELRTDRDYRVRIERVALSSGELDVRPRDERELDRLLAELERPTHRPEFAEFEGPHETRLVLSNARFEGRVFDELGERLPGDGLGIAGDIPLNVRVRRTYDERRPLDVRFEIPTSFFEGIDWSTS